MNNTIYTETIEITNPSQKILEFVKKLQKIHEEHAEQLKQDIKNNKI